jgi:hypothetical protein
VRTNRAHSPSSQPAGPRARGRCRADPRAWFRRAQMAPQIARVPPSWPCRPQRRGQNARRPRASQRTVLFFRFHRMTFLAEPIGGRCRMAQATAPILDSTSTAVPAVTRPCPVLLKEERPYHRAAGPSFVMHGGSCMLERSVCSRRVTSSSRPVRVCRSRFPPTFRHPRRTFPTFACHNAAPDGISSSSQDQGNISNNGGIKVK